MDTASQAHIGRDKYGGQRLTKAGTPIATGRNVYAYDQAGHLIGEYDTVGGLISEMVYLGDMPVLAIKATATSYVQTDQLDTPRSILNAANQVIWRWDVTEPFGNSLPNENPSGLGAFVFNLRHPGQFRDAETGLYQNGYRDYNPGRGRYFESDPIGLAGG
jgi:RHS repeat-associated protein